jgi:hypothetical protein
MTILIVARGKPLIDRMVSLINADGIRAEGTTDDDEALSSLETGEFSTSIIGGGVEEPSRRRLQDSAKRKGVRVIEGALRGKDLETHFRETLLPMLKAS